MSLETFAEHDYRPLRAIDTDQGGSAGSMSDF
jgi:hypothetical protein